MDGKQAIIDVTEPISIDDQNTWSKHDTLWMLGLYGTAIGAGTLFLPIDAGIKGIIPLIIVTLLAFPMTYLSHRALTRFVLSGQTQGNDITHVVQEHFGERLGGLINFLYFFAIFPILLMYSIAITNTTESFLTHQLHMIPPHRSVLAFILLVALLGIIRIGQEMVVRAMSFLVYPFVISLIMLALYLVPSWQLGNISHSITLPRQGVHQSLLMTLWLLIPVIVFSFNHSPIISSFALAQKEKYHDKADEKASRILIYSHLMMIGTVMFFVFSCILSLSPENLLEAKQQNISILSYIANHYNTPFLSIFAPLLAFVAISKSFLGHYLGAREGLVSLSRNIFKRGLVADAFIVLICWIIATLNPSIIGMIETLGGPIIAVLLFIMPMLAMNVISTLRSYKVKWQYYFILLIGWIALTAMLYNLA